MGLDVGERRIGIAISDPLLLTAQGIETYTCKNRVADIAYLKEMINKYEVSLIVAGLPINMNNTEGPQAGYVKELMKELQEVCTVPVKYWDERLTTMQATQVLLEADVSRQKRKKVVDKMAAVLILQAYLDSTAQRRREHGI